MELVSWLKQLHFLSSHTQNELETLIMSEQQAPDPEVHRR
jgi:hypothetical protein